MATETQYYALQKPSYDEVADIEVLNGNFDKIDTQMRNNYDGVNYAKGISSDAYDNSKSYAVGDYCIYDNKLYKCITAITSAEAFDISKWQQTTCGKELSVLSENDAKLNSNLVQLEYGESSGTKNLVYKTIKNSSLTSSGAIFSDTSTTAFDIFVAKIESGKTYTFTADNVVYGLFSEEPNIGVSSYDNNRVTTGSKTITVPSGVNYIAFRCNSGYETAQVEEGTTATYYEPYIPSVKMLSDEVKAQNDSLADYGLDNKLNGLQNGYYDGNTGEYNPISSQGLCNTNPIKATQGQIITIKHDYAPSQFGMGYFTSSGYGGELQPTKISANEYKVIAPSNCESIVFNSVFDKKVTPQTVGHIGVYVNNEIDVLKNDLPTFGNNDNITNIDNAKSDKTYSGIAYKGATNYPDTESNFCMVTFFSVFGISFGVQFAHTDKSDIYSRSLQNGVWTAWKKLNN